MYTDPTIVFCTESKTRSYVKVFYHGKRLRFYTGKALDIACFPNESKNPVERMRLLQFLQFEIKKRLEKGWNPCRTESVKNPFNDISANQCITEIITGLQREDISTRYREDLTCIGKELQHFLLAENLKSLPITGIEPIVLQRFLNRHTSSATYYMTKRRTLAGLFARFVNNGMIGENPVHKTPRKKEVHILNVAFPAIQLKGLLSYLEVQHKQLYLCALLMYGCFLRPHREIRLLQRRHINKECTTITLSGTENKSKRIRVAGLPKYVTQALINFKILDLASAKQ